MSPLPDAWAYARIGVLAPETPDDRPCNCGHLLCLVCGSEDPSDPGRDPDYWDDL